VSGAEQALATLLDYVQRSTHWREGGATRHDAMLALGDLGADVPKPYRPQDCDACPTCGEDGGTSCGMPNCGLLG
jgi:hypothetical protein